MKNLWYILAACMALIVLSPHAHADEVEDDSEPNIEKICQKASDKDRPDCIEALDDAHNDMSPTEWVLLTDCLSEHDALDEQKFGSCVMAAAQDDTEDTMDTEDSEETDDSDAFEICESAAAKDQEECAEASKMLQEALTPAQWGAFVDCAAGHDVLTEASFEACVKKVAPEFMDNPPIEGHEGTPEEAPSPTPP